jgi:hypothetical protein
METGGRPIFWNQYSFKLFIGMLELVNDFLNDESGSHDFNVFYLALELTKERRFFKTTFF